MNELQGILRTLLATGFGFLVGKGYIDQETSVALAGGLGTILIALWSYFKNRAQKKEVAVARVTPASPEATMLAAKVLTPAEMSRASSTTLAPATVSATGKVS